MIQPVFDRLRELLAPFGFDVILITDPAERVWTFNFRLLVRAAGRLSGQVFGMQAVYTEKDLMLMVPAVLADFPERLAREVLMESLDAVRRQLEQRAA